LNSLWGRFSLRNNLAKSEITDDPARYLQLIDDNTIVLGGLQQLNAEAMMITYTSKDEYVIENPSSNIVSLFSS
jgi:hypothetical protein